MVGRVARWAWRLPWRAAVLWWKVSRAREFCIWIEREDYSLPEGGIEEDGRCRYCGMDVVSMWLYSESCLREPTHSKSWAG